MSFAGNVRPYRHGARRFRHWALLALTLAGCSAANEPTVDELTTTPAAEVQTATGPTTHVSDAKPPDAQVDARAEARRAIERGVRWLIDQQHDDGSWRSATYGQMRVGVGDTALVVYGLARTSPSQTPTAHAAAKRGARFLLANLAPEGFVRGSDDASDYPTYGTALLLASLPRLSLEVPPPTLAKLQGYIRSTQQGARQGLKSDDLDFGGWNQTGGVEAELKKWDQSSISATRVALEALEAGSVLDAETRTAALAYSSRCQNWSDAGSELDGGFFFTPDTSDPRNKAGVTEQKRARSYGSTTVDGLLSLVLCGAPQNSPRRQTAVAWLRERFDADHVPGFPAAADREVMAVGLYYYYATGLANCLRRVPELDSAEHRLALVAALVRRQQSDGSWRNTSPIMYENDPLIATALAITALGTLSE